MRARVRGKANDGESDTSNYRGHVRSQGFTLQRADLSKDFGRYFVVACLNSIIHVRSLPVVVLVESTTLNAAEFAWFFSFVIGTIEAHYVHRKVTFKSKATYGESLYWMFFVYTIIGILSTLTISGLIRTFEVQYQLAWVINNILFGLVYFAGLRLLAFPPEVDSQAKNSPQIEEASSRARRYVPASTRHPRLRSGRDGTPHSP